MNWFLLENIMSYLLCCPFFLEADVCVHIVREFFRRNRCKSLFCVCQTTSGCETYFRLKNGVAWSDGFFLICSDIVMNSYQVLPISLCFVWGLVFSFALICDSLFLASCSHLNSSVFCQLAQVPLSPLLFKNVFN